MRRNVIKVIDEIKAGGRNEDSKDFSLLSPLESGALGVTKPGSRGGKTQTAFLLVHRKLPLKSSLQLNLPFPRPLGALLRLGLSRSPVLANSSNIEM